MILDRLLDKKGQELTGWKVCSSVNRAPRLVKLTVPEDTPRVRPIYGKENSTYGKWRAKEVVVESIHNCNINETRRSINSDYTKWEIIEVRLGDEKKIAHSLFDNMDEVEQKDYVKGEKVVADDYNGSRLKTCSDGIHFFINKERAVKFLKDIIYFECSSPGASPIAIRL